MTSLTDKVTSSFLALLNKEILHPLAEHLSSLDLEGKNADELFDLMVEYVSVKKERKTSKKSSTPKTEPLTVDEFMVAHTESDICGYGFSKGANKNKVCSVPVGKNGFVDRKDPKKSRCKTHDGKTGANLFKPKGGSRPVVNAQKAAAFVVKGTSAVSPAAALKPAKKITLKKYPGLKSAKNGDSYTDSLSEYDGKRHFVIRKDANGHRVCVGKIVEDVSSTVIDPLTYEKSIVALDEGEQKTVGEKYKYEFVNAEFDADTEAEEPSSDEEEEVVAAKPEKPVKSDVKSPVSESDSSDDEEEKKSVEKPVVKKEKKKSVDKPVEKKEKKKSVEKPVEKKEKKKSVEKSVVKKPVVKEDSDTDSSDDEEDVVGKLEETKEKPDEDSDSDSDSDSDILDSVA